MSDPEVARVFIAGLHEKDPALAASLREVLGPDR